MGEEEPPARPRQRLLRAAARRIETKDLNVSARVLAAEAGTGVASIYDQFGTKNDLFEVALTEHLSSVARDEERALSENTSSLRALFRALVRHRAAEVQRRPAWFTFAADARMRHERSPSVADAFGARDSILVASIHRFSTELARGMDAGLASRLVSVGLDGVLLVALEERSHYLTDPAFVEELTGALVAAIAASPPPYTRLRARSHASRPYDAVEKEAHEGRRAPTQSRSRELVSTILQGTERVIERRGFDDATTPAIAESAGVSIGSLYQYFRNRESVMSGLFQRWIDHDIRFIRERLRRDPNASLVALLTNSMLEMHGMQVRYLRIYQALFRLLPRWNRYAAAQEFLRRANLEVTEAARGREGSAGLDVDLVVFVLGRIWVAWGRRFIVDAPALVQSDLYRDALERMFTRVLNGPKPRAER